MPFLDVLAVIVTVYVPGVVGVPETRPELLSMLTPAGRLVADQVKLAAVPFSVAVGVYAVIALAGVEEFVWVSAAFSVIATPPVTVHTTLVLTEFAVFVSSNVIVVR